ncbi:MAG: ATP-binding protein, partial [Rubrivivax sp.]
MPGPAGWVRVHLSALPQGGQLTVADGGVGIAPEDLPRLFEPFQRGRHAVGAV